MKTPTPVQQQHVIVPHAVYFAADLATIFGLSAHALRRERRAGRLRVARRLGHYWVLGEWLIEWIRGGELPRPAREG